MDEISWTENSSGVVVPLLLLLVVGKLLLGCLIAWLVY